MSKILQNPSILAAQRKEVAKSVVETLSKDKCDEKMESFMDNLLKKKKTKLSVTDPKLLLTRNWSDFFYTQILDYTINCIKDRFTQKD